MDILKGAALLELHESSAAAWRRSSQKTVEPGATLSGMLIFNHFCNFSLWQLEDQVRRVDLNVSVIVETKRNIDAWNQRRNDAVEMLDRLILEAFKDADISRADLHSETAGMIIDRLSILTLKVQHYRNLTAAASDPDLGRECAEKTTLLEIQRSDLLRCLGELLEGFRKGTRYFKVYRQFKAYNDPRLSAVLG